ncbi:uncharacterized protein VTP21DRAFT_8608 [Calcarisporiella thermophila]|uniref:uncharacterized protein n=1 Tax=Calcarisporiella thermophila TaxID=911321 RepID=UPI003743E186
MDKYRILSHVGEGTYSNVYKACNIQTSELVALKRIGPTQNVMMKEVLQHAKRELEGSKKLHHENVVSLLDYFESEDDLTHTFIYPFLPLDLHGLLRNGPPLSALQIKSCAYMLFRGLDYIHECGFMHRDISPTNVLISPEGVLKISDFGTAVMAKANENKSAHVGTRWYRAPELLFASSNYTCAIDVWSAGCVFAELFIRDKALFCGRSDIHQVICIFELLGTPDELTWPEWKDMPDYGKILFQPLPALPLDKRIPASLDALRILEKILVYSASRRISCEQVLKYPYFTHETIPLRLDVDVRSIADELASSGSEILDYSSE